MHSNSSDIAISVLIPAYNAGNTISAAIDSVLAQTHHNFELIVCNDASSDHTAEFMKSYSDVRIRLLHNETNKGIAATRNVLLREAGAPYIAWLDADDTMMPVRLEKQLEFMLHNPAADIVSSFVYLQHYKRNKREYLTDPGLIRAMMLFKNIMVQPAVMSKNFYKEENTWYDEQCNYIEDYELWSRLLQTKNFAVVPEYLSTYTVPSEEQEHQKRQASGWYRHYNRLLHDRLYRYLNLDLNGIQLQNFSAFLRGSRKLNKQQYSDTIALLRLIGQTAQTDLVAEKELTTVLQYFSLLAARRYSAARFILLMLKSDNRRVLQHFR